MNQSPPDLVDYFPVVLCVVCNSPIDALVALCVLRGEAMDLVAAAWWRGETGGIVANLQGGMGAISFNPLRVDILLKA